jgi:hypothetical protein
MKFPSGTKFDPHDRALTAHYRAMGRMVEAVCEVAMGPPDHPQGDDRVGPLYDIIRKAVSNRVSSAVWNQVYDELYFRALESDRE